MFMSLTRSTRVELLDFFSSGIHLYVLVILYLDLYTEGL